MIRINPETWAGFFADKAKAQLSGSTLNAMMRYILERFIMQRPAIPSMEKQMLKLAYTE